MHKFVSYWAIFALAVALSLAPVAAQAEEVEAAPDAAITVPFGIPEEVDGMIDHDGTPIPPDINAVSGAVSTETLGSDCAEVQAAVDAGTASPDSTCFEVTRADGLVEMRTEFEESDPLLVDTEVSSLGADPDGVKFTSACLNQSTSLAYKYVTRTYACQKSSYRVVLTNLLGVTMGWAQYEVTQATQLSARSMQVSSTARVRKVQSGGMFQPAYNLTPVSCSTCGVTTNRSFGVNFSTIYNATVNYPKPAAGKAIAYKLSWRVSVTATLPPAPVIQPFIRALPTAGFTCDAMIGVGQPGCVFRGVTPIVIYSMTKTPALTAHIQAATASGLPGKVGTKTLLTRATDATTSANRAVACPPSGLPTRPAGKTCDEYPFASSNQGGAGGTRVARSFPGCGMNDPNRTGSTGFSRCYVPEFQQNSQGGTMSSFYQNQRVQYQDAYQVGWVK